MTLVLIQVEVEAKHFLPAVIFWVVSGEVGGWMWTEEAQQHCVCVRCPRCRAEEEAVEQRRCTAVPFQAPRLQYGDPFILKRLLTQHIHWTKFSASTFVGL